MLRLVIFLSTGQGTLVLFLCGIILALTYINNFFNISSQFGNIELAQVVLAVTGIAVSIYFPLAFFLLEPDHTSSGSNIDRQVILTEVFNAPMAGLALIILLAGSFLPATISIYSADLLKLIWFFFLPFAAYQIIAGLIRSYLWLLEYELGNAEILDGSGFRSKFRVSYIKRYESESRVWGSLWASKGLSVVDQQELMKLFIDHLIDLLDRRQFTQLRVRLDGFVSEIDSRKYAGRFVYYDFLRAILNLSINFRKLNQVPRDEEFRIRGSLAIIRRRIFSEALGVAGVEYVLDVVDAIEDVYPHPAKLESSVEVDAIVLILDNFIELLFETIDSGGSLALYLDDLVAHSARWQITLDSVQGGDLIPRTMLGKYLRWVGSKVDNSNGDLAVIVDDVTDKLVPDVDPIPWGQLLHYVQRFSGIVDYQEQAKLYADSPSVIGVIGKTDAFSGDSAGVADYFEGKMQKSYDATIDLIAYIYRDHFYDIDSIIAAFETFDATLTDTEEDNRKPHKISRLLSQLRDVKKALQKIK